MPFERETVERATGEVVDSRPALKPCMSKRCPVCGPQLRRRYVAHFARTFGELAERLPVRFCTFTVDPKAEIDGEPLDPWETRKYAAYAWDKLAKRLRRRTSSLVYFGSFEQHKDGRWHLHVMLAADFEAVDASEPGATAKMLRMQAFGAGFGAVMDVKRLQDSGDSRGDDGKPETVAGAVGYCVKYAFKDLAEAGNERRNSVICSQGIGYHSERAREERRNHVERRRAARSEQAGGEGKAEAGSAYAEEWTPLYRPEPKAFEYADTVTAEDRERFERLDRRHATTTYREKQPNGTWKVYTYDVAAEAVRVERFDRWPDAEGARRIGAG